MSAITVLGWKLNFIIGQNSDPLVLELKLEWKTWPTQGQRNLWWSLIRWWVSCRNIMSGFNCFRCVKTLDQDYPCLWYSSWQILKVCHPQRCWELIYFQPLMCKECNCIEPNCPLHKSIPKLTPKVSIQNKEQWRWQCSLAKPKKSSTAMWWQLREWAEKNV